MKLLKLITKYGNLKWEEGNASGKNYSNTSIEMFNAAEEIFDKIFQKLEELGKGGRTMSNKRKSCATCQFAYWAERMPSCPDCRNFNKWVKSEPRPAPEPIYIGHRTGEWDEGMMEIGETERG